MYGQQANSPLPIDVQAFIPPVRVPGTFGTYPGPSRNPIGVPSIPAPGMIARVPERRRAAIAQARTVAEIAVARASRNARKLAGLIPRKR